MDLARVPIVDNHCHPMSPAKANLPPLQLALEFYHGLGDREDPTGRASKGLVSAERLADIAELGVVHTLVARLSRLLGCEPTLEAVAAERNRRVEQEGLAAWAAALYAEAHIAATVIDSDLPDGAPALALQPGRVLRLFQMGPAIQQLLAGSASWEALVQGYCADLEHAVRVAGAVGVKSHLAEVVGLGAPPADLAEGAAHWSAAKAGDRAAWRRVYSALFGLTLLECQRLEVPVHVHTGITGGAWDGPVGDADPFLLAAWLRLPAYRASRVVLLHAGYPWIESASLMAHACPQVWVDISWVTPWVSLRAVECLRALLASAPLSRLMIGTGGHGTPEVAWLGAHMARHGLQRVLSEAVEEGLLAPAQAPRLAAMILGENAARLYGLELAEPAP
ncbi:MAG: amidohydrolase family protein [Anaerolineae bacterium]|jgi:predicted TIM-barrel fold metal-dependent hydrolase|nr:amidohydrolase family protein [Chloroflexota bacterium]